MSRLYIIIWIVVCLVALTSSDDHRWFWLLASVVMTAYYWGKEGSFPYRTRREQELFEQRRKHDAN